MLTPNGRFKTGIRLCLSMSDYHPETWNPLWWAQFFFQYCSDNPVCLFGSPVETVLHIYDRSHYTQTYCWVWRDFSKFLQSENKTSSDALSVYSDSLAKEWGKFATFFNVNGPSWLSYQLWFITTVYSIREHCTVCLQCASCFRTIAQRWMHICQKEVIPPVQYAWLDLGIENMLPCKSLLLDLLIDADRLLNIKSSIKKQWQNKRCQCALIRSMYVWEQSWHILK